MIYDNILDALGHTPLIRLGRMTDEDSAEVLVKFEGLNVGGSIKTRTAYAMICKAEEQGLLRPDSVIVEPTSGNQGIGLALVGAVRGYRVRIIMPDSVSEERRKLIEHYGAEVVLVHDDGNIGECINECVNIAERMQKEDPKVYVPQQFPVSAKTALKKKPSFYWTVSLQFRKLVLHVPQFSALPFWQEPILRMAAPLPEKAASA